MRNMMTERVRQECCLSPIQFKLYSKCHTKEAFEGFGDFKTGGQVIRTMKYADDLALQGMIERLTEIGQCYVMERYVETTKVMRISREPSPIQIMTDQKQLKNVEYFNYLGSMITNNASCTKEIK